MRLEKELGALNRDIIAIKEKWKIALNIDSKKVAIEKLITMRKRIRDNREIKRMIEEATQEEMMRLTSEKKAQEEGSIFSSETEIQEEAQVPSSEKRAQEESSIFSFETEIQEEAQVLSSKAKTKEESSAISSTVDEEPIHLTVSWLKQRLKSSKKI